MSDVNVLARCNLLAVLRGIEYLVENDNECKELVAGKNLAIQFNVKNGPSANLEFKDGVAKMRAGKHKSKINLYFTSPEHFNKMIDGKANPIPTKGLTKLGFLQGPFTKLADKLGYYLQPTEELLKDKEFYKMNTEMTVYTAFFALSEIANYDEMGKVCGKAMPDGDLQVYIENGIGVYLNVKDGYFETRKGYSETPRAFFSFKDIETAHKLLNGQLDAFTGIGNGDLAMRGFIPMIENMNPLLDIIPEYLG